MLTLLQYAYVIAICLRYCNNMLTLLLMLTLLQLILCLRYCLTAWCASRRINVVSASFFSGLETTLCLLYIDCTMVEFDSVSWEKFFDDVAKLLQELNRQYGVSNMNYAQYALERLEICLSSCRALSDRISSSSEAS